jgi:hypothetical protein
MSQPLRRIGRVDKEIFGKINESGVVSQTGLETVARA